MDAILPMANLLFLILGHCDLLANSFWRFARTEGRSRRSQRGPQDNGGWHDGSRASPTLKDPTGGSQILECKL
eukprot:scaffold389754_cov48-Prasinocladus_malaysianus.AAC.1